MEPDIADYEDFPLEQLVANLSIGKTALCTAIRKATGRTFKERPVLPWTMLRAGKILVSLQLVFRSILEPPRAHKTQNPKTKTIFENIIDFPYFPY